MIKLLFTLAAGVAAYFFADAYPAMGMAGLAVWFVWVVADKSEDRDDY